jgi:L-fuculose-phosphate aldolase
VPGSDLVVITPSGVEYDRLVAEDMSVLELEGGARVEGRLKPSSELRLHLTIYRARPDLGGVVHTHSLYASAFAVVRQAIPPIVEDAAQVLGGSVDCAEYGAPGTQDLAYKAAKALGQKNAVLLANHGLVGVGPTVKEGLRVCQVVEKAANIYALARRLGDPVVLSDSQVAELRHAYRTSYGQK